VNGEVGLEFERDHHPIVGIPMSFDVHTVQRQCVSIAFTPFDFGSQSARDGCISELTSMPTTCEAWPSRSFQLFPFRKQRRGSDPPDTRPPHRESARSMAGTMVQRASARTFPGNCLASFAGSVSFGPV